MFGRKIGDLLAEDVETPVNTVNCVGVMGRGIALKFKNAFPENFEEYAQACKRNEVQPGRMFVVKIDQLTSPRYVTNFPTKRHWRGKNWMGDIESELLDLQSKGIHSIVETVIRRIVSIMPSFAEVLTHILIRSL